jgi:uncharacterized protein YciI
MTAGPKVQPSCETQDVTVGPREWIYLFHPPRPNFAATLTEAEREAFAAHFEYLAALHGTGQLFLAGPTLGPVNTGICVFRATEESKARRIMEGDPVLARGVAEGELREMSVARFKVDGAYVPTGARAGATRNRGMPCPDQTPRRCRGPGAWARGVGARHHRVVQCPRQDSNLRTRFRKPMLYPLSYEGGT